MLSIGVPGEMPTWSNVYQIADAFLIAGRVVPPLQLGTDSRVIVRRLETRPGQPLTLVPHREADPTLAGLRQIQLQHELMIEDAALLRVRLTDLIDAAKDNRDALANLIGDYQK